MARMARKMRVGENGKKKWIGRQLPGAIVVEHFEQPRETRMRTRPGIRSLALTAALLALPAGDSVHAAEIRVLFPAGLKAATDVLVPQFEKSTGHTTGMSYANIGTITNLVRKREAADIAVVSPQQWESLRNAGLFGADLRVRIAHVAVGVAVKKGAAGPLSDRTTNSGERF